MEINRQEFNIMVARVTAIERSSDVHATKITQIDEHLENTDSAVEKLGNLLQAQGLRLALIFGGISVVVTGVGVVAAVVTLLKNLAPIIGK